jgi:uncharacterized protein with von Willebrand factor type A (vWA) domain
MSCCDPQPCLDDLDGVAALVAKRLTAFIRTLRDNGFAVGLREGQDAAFLLARGYGERASLLRSALKHLFCARKADWDRFGEIFDAFWLHKNVRSRLVSAGAPPGTARSPSLRSLADAASERSDGPIDQLTHAGDGDDLAHHTGQGRAEGASRAESLADTDFRKLADPADMAEAHKLAARLAQVMRTRLTRRDLARRRGHGLDLRRTIHRNVGHGGVPVQLVRRRPRHKPLRLIVLLDASGSMSLYTAAFLRFIHGVLDEFREAEAFLFHTRLAHVSGALKEKDAARALDRLSMMAQGVGGGTRIGESLQTFNQWHAARLIHSRTCVMIISDGYETGDAALLGREMAALGRRCRRIVWLNPMLGWQGYAAEAAGMKAALPHVDLFAPANTLNSLAALEPYLAKL